MLTQTKKHHFQFGVVLLFLAVGLLFSASSSLEAASDVTIANGSVRQVVSTTLTQDEIASLTFMREEEKLAHDLYVVFYDKWGLLIFSNISASEQTHTNAVLKVLNAYNIADPASGNGVGVFNDAELQALYDRLYAEGMESADSALRVGVTIEEMDILDLNERLAQTKNTTITRLYSNLRKGSENHLRAYVKNLERQTGTTYTPQYLSQEQYDAINGRGRNNKRGR